MCLDIRLIAMDLDGTALQKDRCYFSPRLLETLHKAHERRIAIVPVTGRQFGLLPPVLQEAHPWKNLAVLCNGGQIRSMHTGAYLHRMDMDPRALEQLLDRINFSIICLVYCFNLEMYRAKIGKIYTARYVFCL